MHLGGKIEVTPKMALRTRDDLSMQHARRRTHSHAMHDDPSQVFRLTIKRHTVAVVTDGFAVLGLGNLGPEAALPVMEGKAVLFKALGKSTAFPICLATQDVDEIVRTVQAIAPVFGGINLEDISAPRCFEVEERLRHLLDIPVFHDDQHGTAVVVIAGLHQRPEDRQQGVRKSQGRHDRGRRGRAAIAGMLLRCGVKNLIVCDRQGPLYAGRSI